MIVLISFSELEKSLFGKVADTLGIGDHVRYIAEATANDIGTFHRKMEFTKKAYPKVLVLNLDGQNNDWRNVLRELKERESWKKIPVLGISTLHDPAVIEEFYAMRGASLIRKPSSYDELFKVSRTAQKYWLNVATLPNDYLTQY